MSLEQWDFDIIERLETSLVHAQIVPGSGQVETALHASCFLMFKGAELAEGEESGAMKEFKLAICYFRNGSSIQLFGIGDPALPVYALGGSAYMPGYFNRPRGNGL